MSYAPLPIPADQTNLFRAAASGAQSSIFPSPAGVQVQFATEQFDLGGNYAGNQLGPLSAGAQGLWLLGACVSYDTAISTSSVFDIQLVLVESGPTETILAQSSATLDINSMYRVATHTPICASTVMAVVELGPDDFVRVDGIQTLSSVSRTILNYSSFWGYKIKAMP